MASSDQFQAPDDSAREVGKSDKATADRAQQDRQDFAWLMSDPRGRRIVWGLLADCGVYRSSFTGSSETFFREGRRDIGLRLLSRAHDKGAVGNYQKMVLENSDG